MKLEQKVTNLEISKRLKELGVKQDGYFMWWLSGGDKNGDYHTYLSVATKRKKHVCNDWASAFTCAELGEMLPQSVEVEGRLGFLTHWKDNISFRVWYETDDEDVRPNDVLLGLSVEADTEADARGKMLIYLIENGLLKV